MRKENKYDTLFLLTAREKDTIDFIVKNYGFKNKNVFLREMLKSYIERNNVKIEDPKELRRLIASGCY